MNLCMKVTASVGSAITVLNAIRSSFGAAIGTDIMTQVSVESARKLSFTTEPLQKPTLLQAVVEKFQQITTIMINDVRISTFSPLPPSRGLKTSSAVASATVQALADYYELSLTPATIVEIGAQASIAAGMSITGAIDDAYASLCGGMAYTDTATRKLLTLQDLPFDREVLLLIPETTNQKHTLANLEVAENAVQKAATAFQRGNIINAIHYNTQAYAPILSNDYTLLAAYNSESTTVGLNGAGPSFFVLYDNYPAGIEKLGRYELKHTKLRPLQEVCK